MVDFVLPLPCRLLCHIWLIYVLWNEHVIQQEDTKLAQAVQNPTPTTHKILLKSMYILELACMLTIPCMHKLHIDNCFKHSYLSTPVLSTPNKSLLGS